jgi:hypothetical protein
MHDFQAKNPLPTNGNGFLKKAQSSEQDVD